MFDDDTDEIEDERMFIAESARKHKKGTKEEDKPKSKPVGNKLVLICKHPDKDETIKKINNTSIVDAIKNAQISAAFFKCQTLVQKATKAYEKNIILYFSFFLP